MFFCICWGALSLLNSKIVNRPGVAGAFLQTASFNNEKQIYSEKNILMVQASFVGVLFPFYVDLPPSHVETLLPLSTIMSCSVRAPATAGRQGGGERGGRREPRSAAGLVSSTLHFSQPCTLHSAALHCTTLHSAAHSLNFTLGRSGTAHCRALQIRTAVLCFWRRCSAICCRVGRTYFQTERHKSHY